MRAARVSFGAAALSSDALLTVLRDVTMRTDPRVIEFGFWRIDDRHCCRFEGIRVGFSHHLGA